MRWILLLAGAVLIAGVWLWGRRRPGRTPEARPHAVSGEDGTMEDMRRELAGLESIIVGDAPPRHGAAATEEKLVVLYVVAPRGGFFAGPDLAAALEAAGLRFGDMEIYHRHAADAPGGRPLFSAANLLEPGTFDPAAMEDFNSPGLALFLRLPGVPDAPRAFDEMVDAARLLAQRLDAEVLDETRSVFRDQTREHLREEIVDYQHRRRAAAGPV